MSVGSTHHLEVVFVWKQNYILVDEYFFFCCTWIVNSAIKKASAADLLDAHRIPFQLMGGKPENVGSLGDIEKVAKVFVRNELIPLQDRIREINGWLGQEVIRFKNYSLDTDNG